MPFLLRDGSTFLHMPRTGGTFVTAVLRDIEAVCYGVGLKHDAPGVCDDIDMTKPLRVFIRDPFDWICSVYAFQAAHDWPSWPSWPKYADRWWHPFAEINDPPQSARDDFDAFLDWLVSDRPGFASSVFYKFADWPQSDRYDTGSMESDLPAMLLKIGCDPARITESIARVSANSRARNSFPLPVASPKAAARWIRSERLLYRRLYNAESKT